MNFRAYEDGLLGAIVRYWNRCFRDRRNFWAVDEAAFRRRVTEKKTAVEAFDASGLIVAEEAGEVHGMIHVGVQPEAVCRATVPGWEGGTRGYVAFFHVDPSRRRQGIGTDLWYRGLERLKGCRQTFVDGQCLNPFYGNSEGPFTPFWGTPEGIAIAWDDAAAKKFLAQKGFAPRHRALTLMHDMSIRPGTIEIAEGTEMQIWGGLYPEVGAPLTSKPRWADEFEYECVVSVFRDEVVAGALSLFPMREVGEGIYGIYELRVADEFQGRGIGRAMATLAVTRLRAAGAVRIDVTTVPDLSPAALATYEGVGFNPAAEWAIY